MAETLTMEEQLEQLKALGFEIEDQDAAQEQQDQSEVLQGLGFEIEDQDTVAPALEEPSQDELDAISTQMYAGMSFEDAQKKYDQLMESEDVVPPILGLGYALYKDPETGRSEYIPKPRPAMFKALMQSLPIVNGSFQFENKMMNPDAKVSGFDKVAMGLGESAGAVVEGGAALAEKAGVEGAVDALKPLSPSVDTGDSFTDALLTDAVPAAAAAIGVGGVINTAVKGYPLIIRALATAVPAEMAASLTTSTDEGTIFLGEDTAMMPIAKGIDLGDDDASKILEQRLNVLGEGLALTSFIGGVAPVGRKVLELGGKFALFPIYAAVAGGSAMEKRIYERLADQLATITDASTPEEVIAARRAIAETVEANKDVVTSMLSKVDNEGEPIVLDTVSALLRGTEDPQMRARAAGVLAGQIQRGAKAPQTIGALEAPQAQLQAEMDAYLKQVGGETSQQQTQTMANAADELAQDARDFVGQADTAVAQAQTAYDASVDEVVRGFKDDLEFGQKIQSLEDLVGTEIVVGKDTSFEAVRDGLKSGYELMTKEKDRLYGAIPSGTPFDYEGFGDALKAATEGANDFDPSGQQLLGKRLVATMQRAYGKTEPTETLDAFGSVIEGAQAVPIEQVIADIAASGVDFKVLYNDVRPAISKLIDEAFGDPKTKEVGRRLVKIKNAIDDQVEWIAENGGEEAAAAAKAAKDYFTGTDDMVGYAQIWRDGGRMTEFAELYDPVMARGVGEAGFQEGSRDQLSYILSGQNADAVANMKVALEQVADPNPIVDYMIADVINGFAGEIRGKAVSGANFASLSENLSQYATALNQSFPGRAAKINDFIRSVNAAAGNRDALEQALQRAADGADEAKRIVKESELGNFLRGALGKEMDTTTGPYNAFASIFKDNSDGIGTLRELKTRIAGMPEARRQVVQDGMEAAYMRLLKSKVQAAKQESGGSMSQKIASIDGMMAEQDQILEIGRELFSDKPEFMNGLTDLLEVTQMVGKGKGASPVAAMSATAFNNEASQATNRLIMAFIGPLSRTGARLRAFAGGVFDAVDPTKRAERMLDNIFANPDKYLELSKKYDKNPMDIAVKENLIRGLTTGFLKTRNEEGNVDQQMMDLLP
ncbi:hypothetical protein N9C80_03120 [Paracoccaceae bacterium]|nr:hypothetical protein [Paracoccaceae bacterium]